MWIIMFRTGRSAPCKKLIFLTLGLSESLAELSVTYKPISSQYTSKMSHKQIYYSDKYFDDHFEYWHVMLPKDIAKMVPKTHLMSESEWRGIGVQQSQGWIHYMQHEPEPHILLFRRPTSNNNQPQQAQPQPQTA